MSVILFSSIMTIYVSHLCLVCARDHMIDNCIKLYVIRYCDSRYIQYFGLI